MAVVRQEKKTREDFTQHDYLIYFLDREDRSWWDWVFRTREGFRHCFLLQWCEWSNRWIMLNWRQSRTDFIILFDFEAEAFLRDMLAYKGTVVSFKADLKENENGALISYCSNIISRFLGLGNAVLLTPYGLYRRLLKSGGEVVFCWRDEANEYETKTDNATETA